MWRQIRLIGRAITHAMARHPHTSRQMKAHPHANTVGHELFGVDVMLDTDGKCWLLECNDSPGLEYCGSHFADGTPRPDSAEGDATTRAVIEDRMALLGYDRKVCDKGEPSNYLRCC